jgi:hypothetical protein
MNPQPKQNSSVKRDWLHRFHFFETSLINSRTKIMTVEKKYIVALDQGTTSSRAVVLDHDANIISVSQREFTQIYPKAGWVEHDPMEIWSIAKLHSGRSASESGYQF